MNIVIDIDNIKLSSKMTKEEFEYIFPNVNFKKHDNVFEYSMIGTIFEMNYPSKIVVYFQNNNIIQLSVFPTKERIDSREYNLEESYNDYNNALEKNYGKKLSNICGKQKMWRFSDATLKHYLFERFCMEERIEVLFKNSRTVGDRGRFLVSNKK